MKAFALQKIKNALITPKTFSEIKSSTKIPERTLRYNMAILKDNGFVKEKFVLGDLRRKIFLLNGV